MPQLLLHLLLLLLLLAATTVAATTADEPEDICLHCSCNRTTVVCNFTHANKLAWVWNGNYKIPNIILAVELQLAGNTEFTLQNGTFHENRVNSFVIKGGYAGNDQVELAQYAFAGNKGGYPEIRIVDVGNVFLRANAFSGSEIKLRVENSKTLDVFPHAFINMNMTCNLINIEQLKIQKNSFSPSTDLRVKSSVILNVENCTIPLIESFDVSMNKIAFKSCTIYTVQSQAFEVTRIDEVSFENCRIEKIEANAFTNKLECGNFSITDSQIGTIEHKAINGSGITALTLRNNNIETIRGNAIEINSIDVYVEENKVKHLDAHWLHVKVADVVSIKDNRFDNYAKLQLDQTSRRANCSFANNLLGQMQAASLNFGSCEVRNITLQRGCSCDDTKHLLPALTEHDLSAEVYCQPPQRLRNCLKLRTVHMRRFGYDACGVNRTSLHCVDNSTLDCWHGDCSSKQEREQQQRGYSIIEIATLVCCILMFVLLLLCVGCLIYKCRRYKCVEAHCSMSSDELNALRRDLSRMEADQTRKDLKRYVQRLTAGKLKCSQCSGMIMELMQARQQLPQTSNKVLADHLQQCHAKSSTPTTAFDYAPATGGDFYARALPQELPLPSAPSEPGVQENIYAEPLLSNEYSSPSDPLDQMAVPVYSEPFNPANVNDMPPAYEAMPQYATPLHRLQQPPPPSQQQQQQQQQPPPSKRRSFRRYRTTAHNILNNNNNNNNSSDENNSCGNNSNSNGNSNSSYAIPVWRSSPSATPISPPALPTTTKRHVRELREDLAAKPQFHPNQLSSARNQIQLQSRFASNPRRTHASNSNNNNNSNNSNNSSSFKRSFECLDGAASLAAMEHMDMRGATALPPDSGSDHSGGSDETVKIDDVIEYADA